MKDALKKTKIWALSILPYSLFLMQQKSDQLFKDEFTKDDIWWKLKYIFYIFQIRAIG